jgi:1-pyrroline-5-carboxylate dehydrogenase
MISLSVLTRRHSTKLVSTVARSSTLSLSSWRRMSTTTTPLPSWATMDPRALGSTPEPYAVQNLCQGQWWCNDDDNNIDKIVIPHPLDRDAHPIFTTPHTHTEDQIQSYVASLRQCPKTGLHNPFKHPERYVQYGEISRQVRVCV